MNLCLKRTCLVLMVGMISSPFVFADSSSAIQDYQAKRYAQAFVKFQTASHQGDVAALYYAGLMYAKGQGVPKDIKGALYCLRLAAAKGSRDAALALADLYQRGDGVATDQTQVALWTAKAAQDIKVDASTSVVNVSTPVPLSATITPVLPSLVPRKPANLFTLIRHSPRAIFRRHPLFLIIFAAPLIFLILFLWMLGSGRDDPLPTPPGLSARGFRVEDAIALGWQLVRRNLGFSVALCLLYLFLIALISQATLLIPNRIASLIVFWFLAIALDAFRTRLVLDTFDHGVAHGSDAREAASSTPTFILTRLIYGMICGVGSLFLIVPGLYFWCQYCFASWIVIDQRVDAMTAMERSSQLTQGIKFRVFIFLITKFFFLFLGPLLLGFGLFFLWPMMWFAEAYFYRSLQKRRTALTARLKTSLLGCPPFFWGVGALAGFVLLIVFAKHLPTTRYPVNPRMGIPQKQFDASKQASYTAEWQRYKPIYDTFQMSDLWAMMDAGKCAEAEQALQNPASYQKMDQAIGSVSRTRTIAMGVTLCHERFAAPQTVESASVAQSPIGRFQSSLQTGQDFGALGSLRVALSQYYVGTNGRYPSTLEDLIGHYGIQNIPALALPDHPPTAEVTVYGSNVCSGSATDPVKSALLKDTGKWAYVSDPTASCFGKVFIDCTHVKGQSGKQWDEY